MKQTGLILRENREKLGLTIQEVSLALKINAKTIKAMEDGDLTQLPPRTFLRGFVHSYAQYLRLDLEHLMSMFNEELGTSHRDGGHAPEIPAAASAENPVLAPKTRFRSGQPSRLATVAVALLAVSILVVIVVVKKTIDKYQRESQVHAVPATVQSIPQPVGARRPTKTAGPLQNPTPTTPSVGTHPIVSAKGTNQPPLNKPASGARPLKQVANSGPLPNQPKPKAKALSANSQSPKAMAKPITAIPLPPNKVVIPPRPILSQELIIEALASVTVHVGIDGMSPKVLKMKANQIRTIKARRAIKLSLSDGGAVSLIYNGRDNGVPGNLGEPINLNFPKYPQSHKGLQSPPNPKNKKNQ